MVQEFVPGRTLRDFVSAPLPMERALDIARQLARALGAAHRAGVVHRDIKPENVMVRPDGYVKVLDFGLAHRTLPDTMDTVATGEVLQKITTEGPIIGTLAYMSPEQASGHRIDSATDVFSLGIVFYEMLTGRRPFEGAAAFSVLHAILSEHPAPPSRLNPEVPPALDALVLAMLAKDASARPTTEGIEAELNAAVGGECAGYACACRPPPHGRPGSRARPARVAPARSCRRPRDDGRGRGRGGHRENEPRRGGAGRASSAGRIVRSSRAASVPSGLPGRGVPADPGDPRSSPPQHDRRRFRRDDETRGADVVRPGRPALARERGDERDPRKTSRARRRSG